MSRFTNPFMHLLVMVAYALVFTLVFSVLFLAVNAIAGGTMSTDALCAMQVVSQVLTLLLPALLVQRRYYADCRADFWSIHFCFQGAFCSVVSMGVILLLLPLTDTLTTWNDSWQLGELGERLRAAQEQSEQMMARLVSGSSVWALVRNLVVVALVPAVCEEAFFRVGMQSLLTLWMEGNVERERRWAKHVAVWLTAVIFSLVHGELFAFVPRLLLGVVLGYIYLICRNSVVNMAAHFVNNAFVVILLWMNARGYSSLDPMRPLGFDVDTVVIATASSMLMAVVGLIPYREDNDVTISH